MRVLPLVILHAASARFALTARAIATLYCQALVARRPPPGPSGVVRFVQRLVQLTPRGQHEETTRIRDDRRLSQCLQSLAIDRLTPEELATLVWSFAVLQRPLRRSEVAVGDLHTALDEAALDLDMHRAAEVQWAWESLARDAKASRRPPPPRLVARTAPLPFAVRLGAVDVSLLAVRALREEAAPQRDVIKSGSAEFTSETVVETRLTAWQSDSQSPFEYSGKIMQPRVGEAHEAGMSPLVGAVRDALAAGPIDRRYDSVLVNYYENSGVGMRFHADPGQGEHWGYSTCVVSAGDCRQFVFRRIGDPSKRVTVALRAGDVVEMFGECQQLYQHSVKTEASEELAGPRISLVYKRTLELEAQQSPSERPDGR